MKSNSLYLILNPGKSFGSPLIGRSYETDTLNGYRFGFNGKETDSESDLQDYGMRIYNPNLGRFLSVDPITKEYPELTPYQFASNRSIDGVDLDGLEYGPPPRAYYRNTNNTTYNKYRETQTRRLNNTTAQKIIEENARRNEEINSNMIRILPETQTETALGKILGGATELYAEIHDFTDLLKINISEISLEKIKVWDQQPNSKIQYFTQLVFLDPTSNASKELVLEETNWQNGLALEVAKLTVPTPPTKEQLATNLNAMTQYTLDLATYNLQKSKVRSDYETKHGKSPFTQIIAEAERWFLLNPTKTQVTTDIKTEPVIVQGNGG